MKACVIGGGSWGSAFALHLGRLKIPTHLWIREESIYKGLKKEKENKVFLPGHIFPNIVSFYLGLQESLLSSEMIFIAVPAQFCRHIFAQIAPFLSSHQIIVSLTKGIEEGSLKRMSEVMEEVFSPFVIPPIAVLSGPSFSREVAEKHPTAVVVASKELALAKKIQQLVSNPYFRAYTSEDVIGVEISGALKNVIAIAAGVLDSLKFGHNSVAGLITRGIHEIARLGINLGAKKETFYGLAGMGDLVLTCTGKLSRNHYVGYELGKGKSLNSIISGMKMIAEGVPTTLSARELAKKRKVEMPICEQVYQVLYENKNPKKAIYDLMSRTLKDEF
jgi:glycerol-3-phosphate dehydrogenase (NAD(P)+)